MADQPIIFSAPMVCALLAGSKTQTRRLAWRVPPYARRFDDPSAGMTKGTPSPWQRAKPGDLLWVRESVRGEEDEDGVAGVRYVANNQWSPIANTPQAADDWFRLYTYRTDDPLTGGQVVPSIHMPRWASRLTLRVTEVRVQRLHDITEADAWAEGMADLSDEMMKRIGIDGLVASSSSRRSFWLLWENLHGADAWHANPEVVALSFIVERRNIDA